VLGAKAAGYHGWPIFLADCATLMGLLSYVGHYIESSSKIEKKISNVAQ
jgi:hypothetical protein